jgi:integrase
MPETDVGTLAELIEGYLASLAGRPSELSMSDFLKPLGAMADRPANAITTQDLVDVLRPIYRRGSPSMADHVRGAARAAFAWAMRAEADYRADVPKRFNLTSNPAVAIPAVRSKAGERWLSVEEVRAFWRWLSAPERAERDTCKVLRLLIVTGQRGREISELRAEQYRDGCLEWATTKTGRPHILPLCPQAERILEGCKGDYLFGLVKHRAVWKTVKAYVEDTGAAEFSPRDLRRTWKTLAGHAGLSKEVRDLLQNHQRGDVSARHYDRYGYMAEKRAGVEVWGEWFYREVEGLGGGA